MKLKFKDEERMPANRVINKCLHCRQDWGYHFGWCCPGPGTYPYQGVPGHRLRRQDIPEEFQYFTIDMIEVPEEDWFAFKHFKAEDANG